METKHKTAQVTSLIREARFSDEARLLENKRKHVDAVDAHDAADAQVFENVESISETSPHEVDLHEAVIAEGDMASAVAQNEPDAIDDAQRERERIERQQQELEALRIAASEEGKHEGYQAGLEQAATEWEEKLSQLRRLLESMEERLLSGIAEVEDISVEIVFHATAKILGEAMVKREGVLAVVREVIKHAQSRERIVVRVSPDDYKVLLDDVGTLRQGGESDSVKLVADDRVELGGCLLETIGGSLDGRLEIQIQQLRETLLRTKSRLTNLEAE